MHFGEGLDFGFLCNYDGMGHYGGAYDETENFAEELRLGKGKVSLVEEYVEGRIHEPHHRSSAEPHILSLACAALFPRCATDQPQTRHLLEATRIGTSRPPHHAKRSETQRLSHGGQLWLQRR